MNDDRQIVLFPSGVIQIPPSKSILHRAIICAELAGGSGELSNTPYSKDIAATIRCMRALRERASAADCGESGTTLRLLIPIAALSASETVFTGQGRLMRRPLTPYLDALAEHGAEFSLSENTLSVKGRLRSGVFHIRGDISSQFISGLLLSLPLLEGNSEIHVTTPLESASYAELTIDVMRQFGVNIQKNSGREFSVTGGQKYCRAQIPIEADYSQAAFFLVAGALGCECECAGLSPTSKQGDKKIIEILKRCGVSIKTTPQGGMTAQPARILPQTVDVSDIPDLVPPLAALFTFCEGTSRIVGAGRLRHKESDRLLAVTRALGALGADITADEDSLTITGVRALRGGRMESCGDHRIAMMGAVAAFRSDAPVWIHDSSCVEKSYPQFWQDFEKIPKEV